MKRPTETEVEEAFAALAHVTLLTMFTPQETSSFAEIGCTLRDEIEALREEVEARRFIMAEIGGWNRSFDDAKLATMFVGAQDKLRAVHSRFVKE